MRVRGRFRNDREEKRTKKKNGKKKKRRKRMKRKTLRKITSAKKSVRVNSPFQSSAEAGHSLHYRIRYRWGGGEGSGGNYHQLGDPAFHHHTCILRFKKLGETL